VVFEAVLPRLSSPWVSPRLAERVRDVRPTLDPSTFGVVGYHEPSLLFALGGGIRLLTDGAAAVRFLAEGPGRIVAIADRQEAAFRAAARQAGLTLREHGVVTGFNYSRGRRVAIQVFEVAP
jgi:hypothetical protein